MTPSAAGALYIVSTPIGNLGDMTFRAVEVLSSAALVVAEDTRHSRHLLDHYRIRTPLRSYHEHNEARETPRLIERMSAGELVALITDAGTPLISDPGGRLVSAAIAAGIKVIPVPGASSVLAALAGSGVPLDRFIFLGFLSRKGKARQGEIRRVIDSDSTVVLFESANRLHATLSDIAAAGGGDRHAVIARELTKQFEEFRRGPIDELAAHYSEATAKGEVVIVVEGKAPDSEPEQDIEHIADDLARSGSTPREVMDRLVTEHRAPRNLAYRLAHSAARAGHESDAATSGGKRVTKNDDQ